MANFSMDVIKNKYRPMIVSTFFEKRSFCSENDEEKTKNETIVCKKILLLKNCGLQTQSFFV